MSEEEEAEIITMVDENGVEKDFVFLTLVEMEEGTFAVLAPKEQIDGDEADLELYAFRYTENDDGVDLDAVEDDDLLNRIYAEAEAILFDADEFEDAYDDETPDDEGGEEEAEEEV